MTDIWCSHGVDQAVCRGPSVPLVVAQLVLCGRSRQYEFASVCECGHIRFEAASGWVLSCRAHSSHCTLHSLVVDRVWAAPLTALPLTWLRSPAVDGQPLPTFRSMSVCAVTHERCTTMLHRVNSHNPLELLLGNTSAPLRTALFLSRHLSITQPYNSSRPPPTYRLSGPISTSVRSHSSSIDTSLL